MNKFVLGCAIMGLGSRRGNGSTSRWSLAEDKSLNGHVGYERKANFYLETAVRNIGQWSKDWTSYL